MAQSNLLRLRNLWFQIHKWIGILLAILIIPVSISGSALVWHDALDEALNPRRFAVTEGAALPYSAWEAAARQALAPGERLVSIRWPEHGGPVVATAAPPPASGKARPGPPVRTNIWIDPATGNVLDRAPTNQGAVRFLHVLHGSLQVPGVGRSIVGWIGVFMLLSSLSGLWLWWPLRGKWTRGLRWNRQPAVSANLHHQMGFWIAIPLAMLSLTGAWISFPTFFGPLAGETPPAPGGRARAMRAVTLEQTRMSAEAAFAAARPLAKGDPISIAWPTDLAPAWKVQFARQGGAAEVEIADATGAAKPPKPPRLETLSRTMRRWHDGTGMGMVWQVIIFIGGIIPAILAVTGIMMWLRTRGWRGEQKSRQAEAKARTA